MQDTFHFLVTRTWWTYDPHGDWYSQPYHWINLIEGVAWLIFAALVFYRYLKFGYSLLELVYGVAFITFGLTDFREAYSVQSWLITVKGINLVALLYLRWYLIKRFYPHSKTY